jgi:hypothetical protein
MGPRVRSGLLWLLICALVPGCAYVPTTSLRYEPVAPIDVARSTQSVAVLPLSEARGPKRYPSMQGHLFKTYIPLLPYIRIPYERLDESHILHQKNLGSQAAMEQQHFTTAFALEIARDLEQSGLFREVRFAATEADATGTDLVLSGALRSTEFDVYASSYMLGIVGVLLWLVPIPVGKDKATVSLELTLRDQTGTQVWSHASSRTASKFFTLYNSGGESTSSPFRIEIKRYGSNKLGIDGDSLWAYHAEALRAALGEAKASLATHIAQTP